MLFKHGLAGLTYVSGAGAGELFVHRMVEETNTGTTGEYEETGITFPAGKFYAMVAIKDTAITTITSVTVKGVSGSLETNTDASTAEVRVATYSGTITAGTGAITLQLGDDQTAASVAVFVSSNFGTTSAGGANAVSNSTAYTFNDTLSGAGYILMHSLFLDSSPTSITWSNDVSRVSVADETAESGLILISSAESGELASGARSGTETPSGSTYWHRGTTAVSINKA